MPISPKMTKKVQPPSIGQKVPKSWPTACTNLRTPHFLKISFVLLHKQFRRETRAVTHSPSTNAARDASFTATKCKIIQRLAPRLPHNISGWIFSPVNLRLSQFHTMNRKPIRRVFRNLQFWPIRHFVYRVFHKYCSPPRFSKSSPQAGSFKHISSILGSNEEEIRNPTEDRRQLVFLHFKMLRNAKISKIGFSTSLMHFSCFDWAKFIQTHTVRKPNLSCPAMKF